MPASASGLAGKSTAHADTRIPRMAVQVMGNTPFRSMTDIRASIAGKEADRRVLGSRDRWWEPERADGAAGEGSRLHTNLVNFATQGARMFRPNSYIQALGPDDLPRIRKP